MKKREGEEGEKEIDGERVDRGREKKEWDREGERERERWSVGEKEGEKEKEKERVEKKMRYLL
jgi:hypothetical protein